MIVNNEFTMFAIRKLAGGSCPHHSFDVPASAEELSELFDTFKEQKSDHKEASEVKISVIFYQRTIEGEIPMLQFHR